MNYPYANGLIKAIEDKVLEPIKLYGLKNLSEREFIRALKSMNYGDNSLMTLEELITKEELKTKSLIDEITCDKENTDLFFLLTDSQNIKILYKKKYYNNMTSISPITNGSIDIKELENAIMFDLIDSSLLTKNQKKLLNNINDRINKLNESNSLTSKLLSNTIDDCIYQYALQNGDRIIKAYMQVKIDGSNIVSLRRAIELNWNIEKYCELFIKGGKIPLSTFKDFYKTSIGNLDISNMVEPYYQGTFSKMIKKNNILNCTNELEKSIDETILHVMSEYKNDFQTIGPMVYYYLLKLVESQNIRTVFNKTDVELKDLINPKLL